MRLSCPGALSTSPLFAVSDVSEIRALIRRIASEAVRGRLVRTRLPLR